MPLAALFAPPRTDAKFAPTRFGWPAEPPEPRTWVQAAWLFHWQKKNPRLESYAGVPAVRHEGFRLVTTRNLILQDRLRKISSGERRLLDLAKQILISELVYACDKTPETVEKWMDDQLADNGFDPQFGARPLKRLIQKQIVNLLSKRILAGDIDKTKPVLVDVFDGMVVFRNELKAAQPV